MLFDNFCIMIIVWVMISVIIFVFNVECIIDWILFGLFEVMFDGVVKEVIVVDGGFEDGIRDLVVEVGVKFI